MNIPNLESRRSQTNAGNKRTFDQSEVENVLRQFPATKVGELNHKYLLLALEPKDRDVFSARQLLLTYETKIISERNEKKIEKIQKSLDEFKQTMQEIKQAMKEMAAKVVYELQPQHKIAIEMELKSQFRKIEHPAMSPKLAQKVAEEFSNSVLEGHNFSSMKFTLLRGAAEEHAALKLEGLKTESRRKVHCLLTFRYWISTKN